VDQINRDELILEEKVLANLSYFEPMRFEQIILDFDSDFLREYPDFNRETLMKILSSLCHQKKVKLIKGSKGEDYQWQRIYPRKRPFWKFWS